jgi:hypothetical protein
MGMIYVPQLLSTTDKNRKGRRPDDRGQSFFPALDSERISLAFDFRSKRLGGVGFHRLNRFQALKKFINMP